MPLHAILLEESPDSACGILFCPDRADVDCELSEIRMGSDSYGDSNIARSWTAPARHFLEQILKNVHSQSVTPAIIAVVGR